MKNLFSNVWFTAIAIVLCLVAGFFYGCFLDQVPSAVHTGKTYGFVAFAVFPFCFCVFGIKELERAFSQIAPYLDAIHRKRLSEAIDKRIQVVIFFAFIIILIQVLGAFYLLYLATFNENLILGVLFGGLVASLVYGFFVCFSVLTISEKAEEVQSKEIGQQRAAEYKDKFQ